MADLKKEITIAGGGLAGLALACALRRHDVPVTVLEAGNYPRHRVCGEFISGVSEETLATLAIADLFEEPLCHDERLADQPPAHGPPRRDEPTHKPSGKLHNKPENPL
jgi:2-polyprenyl-6-methoxyphenol hydroxylase-like FAD-dependent oxidoreductase